MRASELLFKTTKETGPEVKLVSHRFLLRGGFILQNASGLFSLLPLGFRVFEKIEAIVRQALNRVGCQELLMPLVQPARLWQESGRYQETGEQLAKLKGEGEELVLAMTHEEMITDIARRLIKSYEDLPLLLNQIQVRFRNEPRPRGGLLRVREFTMQDAYSFDCNQEGLDQSYEKITRAYFEIFKRLNLPVFKIQASSGMMGGSRSEEFVILSDSGEDKVLICQKCHSGINFEALTAPLKKCPQCNGKLDFSRAIELAHTFQLGTKYSARMGAYFTDQDGKRKPILMGCYGIGLERLMAAIVEVHHDQLGIIWPANIAPFDVYLIDISTSLQGQKVVQDMSNKIKTAGIELLYDDRDKSPGSKFADADLLGIPLRLTISKRSLSKNCIGLKSRTSPKEKLVKLEQVVSEIQKALKT